MTSVPCDTREDRERIQAGDPFSTKKLDNQRVRQRHVLRHIEDWIIEEALRRMPLPPAVPEPADCPLIETALRRYIDEKLPAEEEMLEDMAASLEARAVSDFLAANAPPIGEPFPLDELERDATDLASKYKNRVEVGEAPWLASLVIALVWADELASDGYRDPRLPE